MSSFDNVGKITIQLREFRVISDKLLLQNKNRPEIEDEIAISGNSVYEITCPKFLEEFVCLIDLQEILREIDLQCPIAESLVSGE